MSASNIRIHGAGGNSFEEFREIDSATVRLAELTAPTCPAQISILRDRLLDAFSDFELESAHAHACMALEEALANAIYHGNLDLDSQLKESGDGAFSELAQERSHCSPWKDREVHITELATPFGLWITIRDEGNGFDVESALQRTIDPTALLASGRGLVMMKAFSDELVFNIKGNEVTLVFYNTRKVDIKDLLPQSAETRQLLSPETTLL